MAAIVHRKVFTADLFVYSRFFFFFFKSSTYFSSTCNDRF